MHRKWIAYFLVGICLFFFSISLSKGTRLRVVPPGPNIDLFNTTLLFPQRCSRLCYTIVPMHLALHHHTHCWTFCCARQPCPCHDGARALYNIIIMVKYRVLLDRETPIEWKTLNEITWMCNDVYFWRYIFFLLLPHTVVI